MLSEGKSKWWWNTTLLFCRYVPFGTWGFVQSQTKAILWSSPGKFSQEGFSQPELPAKLSSPPQLDQVSLTYHFTSKFTSFATSPMFIPSFQASPLCCEPHYQVCALESPFAVLEIWKSNNWKNLMEEFVKVIFVPFTCYKIDPDEHSASSTSWSPTYPFDDDDDYQQWLGEPPQPLSRCQEEKNWNCRTSQPLGIMANLKIMMMIIIKVTMMMMIMMIKMTTFSPLLALHHHLPDPGRWLQDIKAASWPGIKIDDDIIWIIMDGQDGHWSWLFSHYMLTKAAHHSPFMTWHSPCDCLPTTETHFLSPRICFRNNLLPKFKSSITNTEKIFVAHHCHTGKDLIESQHSHGDSFFFQEALTEDVRNM